MKKLYNPWNGLPRHPDDVKSDPDGLLMVDPDAPVYAAPAAEVVAIPPRTDRDQLEAELRCKGIDPDGVACRAMQSALAAPVAAIDAREREAFGWYYVPKANNPNGGQALFRRERMQNRYYCPPESWDEIALYAASRSEAPAAREGEQRPNTIRKDADPMQLIQLIRSILRGYPYSTARHDALNALTVLEMLASAPTLKMMKPLTAAEMDSLTKELSKDMRGILEVHEEKQVLFPGEQRAIMADPNGLACLINYYDCEMAADHGEEPGEAEAQRERMLTRQLHLLTLGRMIILRDADIWSADLKWQFKPRPGEG